MIGYYVHHHGRGHLTRASCVAAATSEPVVALSSLPEPAQHPFADWVALAPDPSLPAPLDASAGGALHWAPLDSPDYRTRMAAIAGWVTSRQPRLVVVDVSVEVTALVRVLGTPAVVVAGPGERGDDPHVLGRRLASRVVAPWPALGPADPAVSFAGAFSRFDERIAPPPPGRQRVLVLLGAGGDGIGAADLAAARRATPDWTWHELGGSAGSGTARRWVDDVWDDLVGADVVVTHAGLGALSEVAAARRAAVVLPQRRPFGEQHATARLLARAGLAEVHDSWPAPAAWPAVLDAARGRGGKGWVRWCDGSGASRFVAALDGVTAHSHVA